MGGVFHQDRRPTFQRREIALREWRRVVELNLGAIREIAECRSDDDGGIRGDQQPVGGGGWANERFAIHHSRNRRSDEEDNQTDGLHVENVNLGCVLVNERS